MLKNRFHKSIFRGSLKSLNIKKLDLIKLDIEGSELEALEGMGDTFQNGFRPIIICEIKNNLPIDKRLVFQNFMTSLGYKLFKLKNNGKIEKTTFENLFIKQFAEPHTETIDVVWKYC